MQCSDGLVTHSRRSWEGAYAYVISALLGCTACMHCVDAACFYRRRESCLYVCVQCCHSPFLEFPRLCSKNSQVDLKIPKLIKK